MDADADGEYNFFLKKDDPPEFTLAEVIEMERSFKAKGDTSFSWEVCHNLARKFSCSIHRSGKSSIDWEQVHLWFEERQAQEVSKSIASPAMLKALANPLGISEDPLAVLFEEPSNKKAKTYLPPETIQKSRDESVADLTDLRFEARSSKDYAWFDVASFLNYRVLYTGELEVRVRFGGFGNEEDEWVSVKRAVRPRSIPLEDSECEKVEVGDLVLCYRNNDDHALYCDAHIVDIERRLHDMNGCRCIFAVRYDHDSVEDKVMLKSICCRPT